MVRHLAVESGKSKGQFLSMTIAKPERTTHFPKTPCSLCLCVSKKAFKPMRKFLENLFLDSQDGLRRSALIAVMPRKCDLFIDSSI